MQTDERSRVETLEQIRLELEREQNAVMRKAKIWIGIRTAFVIFFIGYMTWIFGAVAQLNANELTKMAAVSLETQLPKVRADLRDYAIEQAPILTDMAGDLMLEIPARLRGMIEAQLMTKTGDLVAEFEINLDAALTATIDDQLELIQVGLEGSDPESGLDAIVTGVSDNFRETMTEALDEMYIHYAAELETLNSRLERLQRDTDLSESEKIDRQLIEAWMVLVHRHRVTEKSGLFKNIQASY